jgi:hypothetical protein
MQCRAEMDCIVAVPFLYCGERSISERVGQFRRQNPGLSGKFLRCCPLREPGKDVMIFFNDIQAGIWW